MLFLQLLVKVPDVEIEIYFPIQPQHLLGRLHRDPMRAPLDPPLIEQSCITELLMTIPNPPHRPVRYPRYLMVTPQHPRRLVKRTNHV